MQPKIALILLNYNGKKDTLECLESISHLDYENYEVIVVDNGSVDNSVKAISSLFSNVTILETHKNLGFSEGNNVGIRYALKKDFSYFFLLNNDTTITPYLLSAFVQATKDNPKAGIFGAKIFRYYEKNTIDHFGGVWNSTKIDFDVIGLGKKDQDYTTYTSVDYICGCAFFIKREVLEKIGLLEPSYFLIWEDTDFCYRAKDAGFDLISVPQAKIFHKVSSSFSGGKPQMHYFWWRGKLLWLKRNGKFLKSPYKYPLFIEVSKIFRHYLIKSLVYPFSSEKKRIQRRERLWRYKAGIKGVLHFCIGRFGNSY